ncbi:MAG: PIN domain-containing protein [Spirochaetes bacterium]|nr:PIN domain-containing protein [Spirochaetota bacterium]MBU0956546.1 PIN domain-containing protein [Spirochaetota bacterium]
MILLDTNYLIRALVAGSAEAERLQAWLADHLDLCTSAIAWYEFCSGPVDEEGIQLIQAILEDRIIPYTAAQATETARLFNAVGRPRHLRVDAMLAAAAITTSASFATGNTADFKSFVPFGLTLV